MEDNDLKLLGGKEAELFGNGALNKKEIKSKCSCCHFIEMASINILTELLEEEEALRQCKQDIADLEEEQMNLFVQDSGPESPVLANDDPPSLERLSLLGLKYLELI